MIKPNFHVSLSRRGSSTVSSETKNVYIIIIIIIIIMKQVIHRDHHQKTKANIGSSNYCQAWYSSRKSMSLSVKKTCLHCNFPATKITNSRRLPFQLFYFFTMFCCSIELLYFAVLLSCFSCMYFRGFDVTCEKWSAPQTLTKEQGLNRLYNAYKSSQHKRDITN